MNLTQDFPYNLFSLKDEQPLSNTIYLKKTTAVKPVMQNYQEAKEKVVYTDVPCLKGTQISVITSKFGNTLKATVVIWGFLGLLSFILMIFAQNQEINNPTKNLGWIITTSQVILFFSIMALVMIWVDRIHMKYKTPEKKTGIGSVGYVVLIALILFVGLSVVIVSGVTASKNTKVQSLFVFNLSLLLSVLFVIFLLFHYRKNLVLRPLPKGLIYLVSLFLFIFIISYGAENPVSLNVD